MAQAQRLQRGAPALPPGLPRPHYKYRTTVAPPAYRDPVVIEADPDALITPAYGSGRLYREPAGHAAAAGLHARSRAITAAPFDYDYQGPYYGGPYVSYWWRLPYACGVYGYC